MFNRLCFLYDDENKIQLFDDIKQLYNKMIDDVSKQIFINRLLYSITNEQLCMKQIINYR